MMSDTIVRLALSGFFWPIDEGQMTSDKIWRHVTYFNWSDKAGRAIVADIIWT
jgi:hypothetical protein